MREVHLPVGASEVELELAERVARALGSERLVVCWTGRWESVRVRRERVAWTHRLPAPPRTDADQ